MCGCGCPGKKGKRKMENAVNLNRIPSSEEIFNVGPQPSIPTRNFQKVFKEKPVDLQKKTLRRDLF